MSPATIALSEEGRARPPRRAGFRQATEHSLFGVLPLVVLVALIISELRLHTVATDFHVAYYPAAQRLLDGLSPYQLTPAQVRAGTGFVYPALSALLFAPFALMARGAAQIFYMLLCIVCVPATLRTLNVRDWRVYGVVLLWLPVFDGWESGNVTLPLALLVALVWRHRQRPWVAGLLTAAAISIKPLVWPLGLWLLATRRWRAAAWALAGGLALNLIAWGLVGFNEVSTFLHLSSEDTTALWKGGYSLLAVAHHAGLGRGGGEILLVLCSLVAAAAVVYLGALRRRDREALALAVALMLLASPLVWAHYFALLLVPLALLRPRLRPVWALPILMWPMPPRQPVHGWEEALAWGVTATVLAVSMKAPRPLPSPREPASA